MAFSTKKKRFEPGVAARRPRMPTAVLIRMFVIGSVGVFAAGYAIYRHYYVPRPPMVVPAPPPEFVAPELVPLPASVAPSAHAP